MYFNPSSKIVVMENIEGSRTLSKYFEEFVEERLFYNVGEILREFHLTAELSLDKESKNELAKSLKNRYNEYVYIILQHFPLSSDQKDKLNEFEEEIISFSSDLMVSFIHGDFLKHNVLLKDGNPIIIDWEWLDLSFSIIDVSSFSLGINDPDKRNQFFKGYKLSNLEENSMRVFNMIRTCWYLSSAISWQNHPQVKKWGKKLHYLLNE
jgi:aminoglycoside phosphotransferase (APT) family kinase protein